MAKVVVVDSPAGEVGIDRRHVSAAQDGIEKGELHELFAALPGLPDVRVGYPKDDKQQVCRSEDALTEQHDVSLRAPKGGHLAALSQPEQQRDKRDPCQRRQNVRQAVLADAQAGQQPNDVPQQQPAQCPRQQIAAVTKAAEDAEGDRPGDDADQEERQPPDDHCQRRRLAGNRVPAEILYNRLLAQRLVQQQCLATGLIVGWRRRRGCCIGEPQRLPQALDQRRLTDVPGLGCFPTAAQQRVPFGIGQIAYLAEDQHARMVVEGEALIRAGVVNRDAQQVRTVDHFQRPLVAQLTVEKQLVIAVGHRIALREIVHRAVDAVRRQCDVIRRPQRVLHALVLLGCVLFERSPIDEPEAAAIAVWFRQVVRQRVIPLLRHDGRAIGDVGIHPLAGFDPGMRGVVDTVDIGQRP